MSHPPPLEPPGPGNLVDPEVLAQRRRARHAELGEEAALELKVYELERRLSESESERERLRAQLRSSELELRGLRQREFSEQRERLEAEGAAAAARGSAASEVASLRERLAVLDRQIAEVAQERDAARVALARAGDEAGALERRLEGERQARGEIERRLEGERRVLGERVRAVEGAVATVRDRLATAASGLRERVAAERAATREARARITLLEHELARRAESEAELRAAVDGLRAELASARVADPEREARMAGRLREVLRTAASLRASVDRELAVAGRALAEEQAALGVALAIMEERIGELADAAGALREELATERAARWVAEAELDAERRRGADDRAARRAAEAERDELRAALDEGQLTAAGADDDASAVGAAAAADRDVEPDDDASAAGAARPSRDPAALAGLRDALDRLRAEQPEPVDAAIAQDLAAAARRLREAQDGEPREDEPREDDASPPAALTARGEPREGAAPALAAPPAAAPTAAPAAQSAAPPAAAPECVPLPGREPVTACGPWLRDGLALLHAEDPGAAERLLVALLPAQAGLVRRPLAYDLEVEGGSAHVVVLADGRIDVIERPESGHAGRVRVSGPLAALAPLAAGGAARRLPGAEIEGRRRMRRLIAARRAPLGLADLAQRGIAPEPDLLLAALVLAAGPIPDATEQLAVVFDLDGFGRLRLESAPGRLALGGIFGASPAATLHTTPAQLPAVLAGAQEPSAASAEGDLEALQTLLRHLDDAQRRER